MWGWGQLKRSLTVVSPTPPSFSLPSPSAPSGSRASSRGTEGLFPLYAEGHNRQRKLQSAATSAVSRLFLAPKSRT